MKDRFEQSETGNWNVAGDYTKLKIFKLLYEADQLETIAKFGCLEIEEEFYMREDIQKSSRIKALKRLVFVLKLIIENTKFALKYKEDKESFINFYKDLIDLEEMLPSIEAQKIDKNKTKIEIYEEMFNKIFEKLIEIKKELLEPLNKSDLIFVHKEEFDPIAYQQSVEERFVEGD